MFWRVWYDDGSMFCSDQGGPWAAPRKDGVLCILFYSADPDDVGWKVLQGFDWYYFVECSPSPWWGSTLDGMLYQLRVRLPDIRVVMQAALVDTSAFNAAIRAACDEKREREVIAP